MFLKIFVAHATFLFFPEYPLFLNHTATPQKIEQVEKKNNWTWISSNSWTFKVGLLIPSLRNPCQATSAWTHEVATAPADPEAGWGWFVHQGTNYAPSTTAFFGVAKNWGVKLPENRWKKNTSPNFWEGGPKKGVELQNLWISQICHVCYEAELPEDEKGNQLTTRFDTKNPASS